MRITESRMRQIIREETRRIIRENDEGPSEFRDGSDYASWEDVYDALNERINFETGRDGIWSKTGYRPEPGAPRGPTHMMEGNYTDLFSFIHEYLFDFIGPNAPFGRYYRGPKPVKVFRARVDDRDTLYNGIIRFMREFESKFPGTADQHKIDDRRLGGPGPNRTRLSPLSVPIPYFEDFKRVIVTWLANTLTGENHPIPWPKDQGVT